MMNATELLQYGIAKLKAGDIVESREILTQVIEKDPHNEVAWLWLSGAVVTDSEKRQCLEHVLTINPNNTVAQRGLAMLNISIDNINSISDLQSYTVPSSSTPITSAPTNNCPPSTTQAFVVTPEIQQIDTVTIEQSSKIYPLTHQQTLGNANTVVRSTKTSSEPRFRNKAKATKKSNQVLRLISLILSVIGILSVYFLEFHTDYIDIRGQFGTSEKEKRHTVEAFINVMTESATATAIASNIAGRWMLGTTTSPMNDTKIVFIHINANNGFRSSSRYIVPELYILCKDRQLKSYINLEVIPEFKYSQINNVIYSQIQVRFDRNSVSVMDMNLSTDNKALFFRNTIEIVNIMKKHSTLLIQFTPVGSSPEIVEFDLTGLNKALMPVLEECQLK